MNIDQYAYKSKLKNYDTFLKMYFSFTSIGIVLLLNDWYISIIMIFIMAIITTAKGGIPLKIFVKLLGVPMAFLIIGVLGIAISFGWEKESFIYYVSVFNGFLGLTKIGVNQGISLFLKALGATASMYFLILNTPMIDLMFLWKKLKVPKLLIQIMDLMHRFIFILLNTANTIYTAQKSRLGYSRIKTSYHSLGGLASLLLIRSYKRSDELYMALEARGYDGELNVLEEKKIVCKVLYVWVTLFELGLVSLKILDHYIELV